MGWHARSTGWSPSHPPGSRLAVHHARELARIRAFAACTPRELTRIAKWGDLTEVTPGHVIVREGHSDWWFFVVVSGRVTLSHGSQPVGQLGPGEQFGETALVGLRPQPATATADETSVLFVLGPRYVLTLLSRSRGFRSALFPDVDPRDFSEFGRRMHAAGEAEWRRIAAAHEAGHEAALTAIPSPRTGPRASPRPTSTRGADQVPGRPLSLAEAVRALAQIPEPPPPATPASPAPRRLRWWLAAGLTAVAGVGALLFAYHPPRLVLRAGRPINVLADVRITGARTYPPSGRYLMLWIKADHPNLAGLLAAWVSGRPTVALHPEAEAADSRVGREQYLDSQATAIHVAMAEAGADPRKVSVRIRDRGFAGPSAGLVYALAIEDLLTPGDRTAGRTIGVTGGLLRDGSVEPIGWLTLKAQGAADDHATMLLVPDDQAASGSGYVATTCGASTFRQALADLTRAGGHCISRRT